MIAYVYDGQNRVVQTIDPDGGTNIVMFDLAGRQQKTINKLGWPTTYAYDWQNRLVLTTFADGTTSSSTYDANGNRITSVDQLGRTTVYTYDPLNRLTNTAFADLTTNVTVYDDLGRVKFTIDARGVTNAFGYDLAGRRVAVTNGLWTTVAMTNGFVFDGNGNQTAFIDGAGHTTSFTFDALNRQTVVTFPDPGTTKQITIYDAASRRIGAVDQANITNWFAYDGVGRLTAVTNALGAAQYTWAQYQYDEAGNLTQQTDALNRITSFAYDSMGRRTKRTLPGLQAEKLGYDLVGNLILDTNFNGVVITNQYDALNRVTNRLSIGGYQVAFVYTNDGQRIKMTDPSGIYAYYYDKRDRLLTNVTPAGTLSYAYDANGNVTSISSSTANGTSVTYQYDALNRLTNVVDARLTGGAQSSGYGFDTNSGNLQRIAYANGVTNLYQYDSLNRLTNVAWNLNGSALGSFAYQLGAAGNRTNMVEVINGVTRTNRWVYDSLYRLTTEAMMATSGGPTNFWGTNTYTYDLAGNRQTRTVSGTGGFSGLTNQSLTFDNSDRLDNDSNPGTPSTWFDPNGNTTNYGGSFQYDVENRLTGANGTVTFVYNGDGQRVKKVVSGVTTLYLVDSCNPSGYYQVLEELSSSNNLITAYTYGVSLISQRTPSVATNFYGCDGLGSIRFLLTSAGAVTNTYAYDAFGDLVASTGSLTNNYRHQGEQYDPDIGRYFHRARERDQNIGRFMSQDSVEGDQANVLSRNLYIFAGDNVIDTTDPSGHDLLVDISIASSIGAGLDSLYTGGVVSVGNALQKTLIGVQNGETANAILGGYLQDVAIGVGVGVAIGAAADIAGDLVFGGNVEGEAVEVEVNTPNFASAQNFAKVETPTETVLGAVARAAKLVKQNTGFKEGMPGFGTKVHTQLKQEVDGLGSGLRGEVSYLNHEEVAYGTPGSVRLDVVKGGKNQPEAIWDLKTGGAKLTKERIDKIRSHLPPQYKDIPIAEVRIPGASN